MASAVGQAAQVDSLLGNDFGKYDTVFSAGDAYSEQRKTNDENDARKLNAGTKLRMVMEMERLRDAARGGSTDRALRQAAKELQNSYKNLGSGGFLDRQYNQRFRDASRELWECLKLETARAAERKREILREVAIVAAQSDTKSATAKMRGLREQFRSAGTAGPEERALRDAFEAESKKLFDRSKAEAEARQAERARKQKEWQARQAEKERKQKEWEARQAEKERKQKEWQARQDEKERKQKEWEARQAEKERKQKEWEARQA
ncbi:DUF349 domain-containing protein, partial [Pseudarthrobacter sp. efr-133-R2A-89]|uniref:DUF349 domain-containing protein n=1 Tax=Pseudarthrobacter sp. efr-133-R2A-89 TaxID=3040302 RepID=UPI00330666FE